MPRARIVKIFLKIIPLDYAIEIAVKCTVSILNPVVLGDEITNHLSSSVFTAGQ
jgi:hypothetical protein